LMVIVYVGKFSVTFAATGLNPESKPPSILPQGSAKEDWVAVWFFCSKLKTTWSPGWAEMASGLYMRAPADEPTVTWWTAAVAKGTATSPKDKTEE